ncbi:hypothetical protein NRIC_12040 [Enterococcus florum]|uniref:Uncharacterized protein n=1 Tax=Enterococcus florum TaxID=2480627 RepID=A0A4P5PIY6_9ENTE|nr:hypothetical protein [Enterococcus florum]GCF93313.1 hypothetical protein NRIC_12040 [Enterococcus florum]
MQEQPFTMEQLFRLKRQTLEKRIFAYYDQTKNEANTLKLLVVLQVRDRIGFEDFSWFLCELVRSLYRLRVTHAMKRYLFYFQHYFSPAEWQQLLQRLFPEKRRLTPNVFKLLTWLLSNQPPLVYRC